jgi:hypothetical protein
MRSGPCQRWVAVSDARSVGAEIEADDVDFARMHEKVCSECRVESAVWRSFVAAATDAPDQSGPRLGHLVHETIDGPATVDRILAAAQHGSRPLALPETARRRWQTLPRVGSVAALLVATGVAAGAVMWLRSPPATVRLAAVPRTGSEAPAAEATATPRAAPSEPPAPDDIPPAYRCESPAADLTVCVAAASRVRGRRLHGARRTIDLREGGVVVSIARQARDASVVVTTPSGRVTAADTVFSVEVDGSGATWARVERGTVRVARFHGRGTSAVEAGQKMRLDDASRPTSLPEAERSRDLAVLAVEVADSDLPPAPRPQPVDTGRRAGAVPAPRPDDLGAGAAAAPDPRALLERARALFGRGAFAAAAQAYQSACDAAPASPEGRAALVSLGDLRLSELGDARGALSAFDAYLASGGGVLAPEAQFGRIGALRALGRVEEARTAARAFVEEHPTGPRADAVRRRLEK